MLFFYLTKKSKENLNFCKKGPAKWHRNFPLASGAHQSPIDILTETASFDPKLAIVPLTFTYDQNCFKFLKNTGHSFEVSGDPDSYSGD